MSPREPLRFAPQFQASYFPIRLGLVPSAPTMFIPEYEESVPFLRTANGSLSAAGAGTGFLGAILSLLLHFLSEWVG